MISSENSSTPAHIAIIMDGNRRWAKQFGMSSALGHAAGVRRVRGIVQACVDQGVRYLTLFAFSTENWQRPVSEVTSLIGLLALYLKKEIKSMGELGVCFKVVGDLTRFDPHIQELIQDAQASTAKNTRITLTLAVNYGGRQDLICAMQAWQTSNPEKSVAQLTEKDLSAHLSLFYAPDPDLLIRTGGEQRVSNFLLWQMAYSELYFTDVLWPNFSSDELNVAINWFRLRERRFGGSNSLRAANA